MSHLWDDQHQNISIPKYVDMFKMEHEFARTFTGETREKKNWKLWLISWAHSYILLMFIINCKVYSHHKHGKDRVQKNAVSSLRRGSVFLRGEVCYSVFLTCALPGNEMGNGFPQNLRAWQDHCNKNDERDKSLSFWTWVEEFNWQYDDYSCHSIK